MIAARKGTEPGLQAHSGLVKDQRPSLCELDRHLGRGRRLHQRRRKEDAI